MTQLIVGAGEVGTALHAVLSRAHPTAIRDVEPVDIPAEVLHVAIPWSERFVAAVRRYEVEHGADLVIVHSTVPVGTCDPERWVHSPVRGRHPDLAESLTAFVKHVGGTRAKEAAAILEPAGIGVAVHDRAVETEAGKLAELAQYALQVIVEKDIHAWCEREGLNFSTVYTTFAESYNAGYEALGEHQFVRPVLRHMPGPIGGHCVMVGAKILGGWLGNLVTEYDCSLRGPTTNDGGPCRTEVP